MTTETLREAAMTTITMTTTLTKDSRYSAEGADPAERARVGSAGRRVLVLLRHRSRSVGAVAGWRVLAATRRVGGAGDGPRDDVDGC